MTSNDTIVSTFYYEGQGHLGDKAGGNVINVIARLFCINNDQNRKLLPIGSPHVVAPRKWTVAFETIWGQKVAAFGEACHGVQRKEREGEIT